MRWCRGQGRALLDAPCSVEFSLCDDEFFFRHSHDQKIARIALAASCGAGVNREKLIPWHERRAVAVAVDQARDPVGLDDFAKALFCLRRPPFRHAADPREMLEDDDRTPAVSDMFCEVVAEELERTRGIVLRAVHAFHIERTGAAEEVELHEMQVVPIPRIVEPIFRAP